MDAHTPDFNNLTDLERRLTGWRPDAAGLTPDAMLFAAGRASARPGPGRFVWPAIAACMTLIAVSLGGWLRVERTERLALAQVLRNPGTSVGGPAATPIAPEPLASPEKPLPDSYLAVTRLIRQDPDAWLAQERTAAGPAGRPPANPSVLRAWPRSGSVEP